jgi:hypothetical protein
MPQHMTLTISIDEQLVQRAQQVAKDLGTSLDQLIRQYLEGLTSRSSAEADIAELRRLSQVGGGDSGRWRFDRDEIHQL